MEEARGRKGRENLLWEGREGILLIRRDRWLEGHISEQEGQRENGTIRGEERKEEQEGVEEGGREDHKLIRRPSEGSPPSLLDAPQLFTTIAM